MVFRMLQDNAILMTALSTTSINKFGKGNCNRIVTSNRVCANKTNQLGYSDPRSEQSSLDMGIDCS